MAASDRPITVVSSPARVGDKRTDGSRMAKAPALPRPPPRADVGVKFFGCQ